MKYKFTLFLFVVFTASSFSQTYNIVEKKIEKTDKKLMYTLTLSYPQIEGLNNSAQDGFNSLMKTRMQAEEDSVKKWMKEWKQEMKPTDTSYYEIDDSVFYKDANAVSVLFYVESYFSGAAHPNNWSYSANYDLAVNKEIFLSDLFTGDYVKKLSEYCMKDITRQKRENYAPELNEPDEMIKDGAGPKEENFKVFNATTSGLLITFPTLQVGAYVEGPTDVLIPYNELIEYIKQNGIIQKYLK
jgi:hypothetical protein